MNHRATIGTVYRPMWMQRGSGSGAHSVAATPVRSVGEFRMRLAPLREFLPSPKERRFNKSEHPVVSLTPTSD
jgi:hypothetical protein